MRPIINKTLCIFGGLAASLILIEVLLRIGSLVVSPMRSAAIEWPASKSDAPLAVFVGDSHTFGLWVDESDALPAAAEKLARENCSPGFRAANLGRCGATTWITLDEGLRALEKLRPSILICRCGFNNSFTIRPGSAGILDYFHITKFARIAFANYKDRGSPEKEKSIGIGKLRRDMNPSVDTIAYRVPGSYDYKQDERGVADLRRRDLITLANAAKSANCRFIFLTYLDPSPAFRIVNNDIRRAAEETGSLLVDLEPLGRDAIARGMRSEFLCDDGHPKRIGYAMEARMLVNRMLDSGILRGARAADPLNWYLGARGSLPDTHALPVAFNILKSPAGDITFEVSAAPGLMGWICAGAESATGADLPNLHIPVEKNEALASGNLPGFQFTTDAAGKAIIAVDNATKAMFRENHIVFAMLVDTSGPVRREVYSKAYYVLSGSIAKAQVRSLR
ncbi:MAG: SGNH/GDSL hydrolase family protein [Planctomycetes bacterium]|nr:SGNH/GDSL hydrolase family protein [Planctomycetota bacterium]